MNTYYLQVAEKGIVISVLVSAYVVFIFICVLDLVFNKRPDK